MDSISWHSRERAAVPRGTAAASPAAPARAGTALAERPATPGASRREIQEQRANGAVSARSRRRLVRRVLLGTLFVLAIPVAISYVGYLTRPGTDPLGVRSVEWLKDHGFTNVVLWVEKVWYTSHAPQKGGGLTAGIPTAKTFTDARNPNYVEGVLAAAAARVPPHLPTPTNATPLVDHPAPLEGIWQAAGRRVHGYPAVYTAFMRPDNIHTGILVGLTYMDTKLTRTVFVPGLEQPGGPQFWNAQIAPDVRCGAIAAFNSGFKMQDALGGYYNFGQEIRPLRDNAASFVIKSDGTPMIGAWGRDFQMGPDIAVVRQNLALMIDNGQLVPSVDQDNNAIWGGTLGSDVYVWRSGVGIDKNGGLIYVGGDAMTVKTLAKVLQAAGAVRAMELDINSVWVNLYLYEQTNPADCSAITGRKLLEEMRRPGDRYLQPGERDFFTILSR